MKCPVCSYELIFSPILKEYKCHYCRDYSHQERYWFKIVEGKWRKYTSDVRDKGEAVGYVEFKRKNPSAQLIGSVPT